MIFAGFLDPIIRWRIKDADVHKADPDQRFTLSHSNYRTVYWNPEAFDSESSKRGEI